VGFYYNSVYELRLPLAKKVPQTQMVPVAIILVNLVLYKPMEKVFFKKGFHFYEE